MNISEKENIKFRINSLRKDKIIYAIESCAITLICLLLFVSLDLVINLTPQYKKWITLILQAVAVGYGLYMGYGNLQRLRKIRELELLLSD
jgi:hypothetical protein